MHACPRRGVPRADQCLQPTTNNSTLYRQLRSTRYLSKSTLAQLDAGKNYVGHNHPVPTASTREQIPNARPPMVLVRCNGRELPLTCRQTSLAYGPVAGIGSDHACRTDSRDASHSAIPAGRAVVAPTRQLLEGFGNSFRHTSILSSHVCIVFMCFCVILCCAEVNKY